MWPQHAFPITCWFWAYPSTLAHWFCRLLLYDYCEEKNNRSIEFEQWVFWGEGACWLSLLLLLLTLYSLIMCLGLGRLLTTFLCLLLLLLRPLLFECVYPLAVSASLENILASSKSSQIIHMNNYLGTYMGRHRDRRRRQILWLQSWRWILWARTRRLVSEKPTSRAESGTRWLTAGRSGKRGYILKSIQIHAEVHSVMSFTLRFDVFYTRNNKLL